MSEKPKLSLEERRARRQARREKKRAENVGRAKKMHLARLEYERTAKPRGVSGKGGEKTQYHVGCSGWFYWHWRDAFYPAGTPGHKWFEYYASRFDTVELNAPFYSW